MSRTVAFAVIVVMNAVLVLVLAMSLTGGTGGGSGGFTRALMEHVAPSGAEANGATVERVNAGLGGLTLSAHG